MSPTARIDPDELALLEEERDHLLGSLEDLEREFAAGDMDELDYTTLKDDYTVRAAEVLEAIDERRMVLTSSKRERRPGVTLAVVAGVIVFSVVAGVLLARASGQRGGGAITGAVGTLRSELATCQTASFQDPPGGIECYDEILADSPDNLEALTYQGWAKVRDGDIAGGAANFSRVVELDPDYPDVRAFRAIVAARAGDYELAAAEIDRFYRNDPPPSAVQVLQSQGLEREVFVLSLEEATRDCWQSAAAGQDAESPDTAAFVADLGTCLDEVLAADPTAVDALVSRAYVAGSSGADGLSEAIELADRAVAADPQDGNALLLRASLALSDGRIDDAEADLTAVEAMQRPTASFLLGSPDQLREALDTASAPSTSAPTTTTASGSSGSGLVPNPDGG